MDFFNHNMMMFNGSQRRKLHLHFKTNALKIYMEWKESYWRGILIVI
jgi:hypothetical protein